MTEHQGISRRSFLKSAACAGVAGTLGAGLVGCSPKSAEQASVSAGETGDWGTFDNSGKFTPSFLVKPDEFSSFDEEVDADVVVIGFGSAGVHAARAAMEEGARVVVLEKGETNHVRSHQVACLNSSIQKQFGRVFTDEDKAAIMKNEQLVNAARPDMAIWRYFLDHSGEDIDWLLEAVPNYIVLDPNADATPTVEYTALDGTTKTRHITQWRSTPEVEDEENIPYLSLFNMPENPTYDYRNEYYPMFATVMLFEPDQQAYTDYIIDMLEESGMVDIRYKTWGKYLLQDDSGCIIGAAAQDVDGKTLKINASSVILATGDYASNERMKDYYCKEALEYSNWKYADTDCNGELCNQGEGMMMGVWAGGKVETSPHSVMSHTFGGALGCDPFLLVDHYGHRFMNEDIPGYLWSAKLNKLPNKEMWQIFDDEYANQVGAFGIGHALYWKVVGDDDPIPFGLWIDQIGYIRESAVKEAITCQADSIEELAEQMGVDPSELSATIDRYNELAESGSDLDFGKRADRMFPLQNPPYYATQIGEARAYLIVSGLCCDAEARVLDETNNPVPGLYACGNAMGNRFSSDYPCAVMGVSHGFCITYGRKAGMSAARRI